MRQKYLLTAICLLLAVAARAYVTTWPLYGEVFVEDIALADDNSTIVNNIGDCYYDYQYCPALHIAALRHIYPSNASGERDFVLVPTYIIVDGVAYHVVGVSGQLLGDDANTIKNIYLHNELEFLGSRALYNATAVSSITIPASVRSIAYDVFNGLGTTSAIRTLTFADGNEPLAIEGAYSNGRMIIANLPLHTLHLGRTFAGNSYGTTSGSTLQQTLVNLTVGGEGTEVSPGTFKEFPNLTNVTFNAGVASIGANAFEKCPKLESVTMSAVARIGDYAFASDSLITSLSLGEGVRYIGDYAFNDCKRVSSLTLPASLDSVHVRAFVGMAGVQTITIADTDSPLQLFGIGQSFYGSSAFSHLTALETAYVGRNLLPTPNDTRFSTPFYNAAMKHLTVGNHVTTLGTDEFNGCQRLEQVQLGSNIASIGQRAFYNNTSLLAITIPDRVTAIGAEAFASDSAMTTLNLGAGVKIINDYAFNKCKRVSSLTLPASLDSVHVRAFVGMAGVQTITIADTDSPLQLFGIGQSFYGSSAFSHLTALETAYVGRNLLPTPNDTRFSTPFYNAAMKHLTVGNHVTTLGTDEFNGCQRLEQVQLGSNIASIGQRAFYNNTSLLAITIPDRVTAIGAEAFASDSAMTTLNLGAGVKIINDYAFNKCKRVSSLTLPASLDSVHVRAFVGMAGVQTITIADTDSPLQLFGVPSGINAHESMLSHLTALESAYMGRNLQPTTYGNSLSAFHKAAMKRLTVGDQVTAIGTNEFRGCTRLEQLQLGSNIASIGDYAFYDNRSLSGASIPDKVTRIGEYAFYGDSAMTTLSLGEGVRYIGDYAFNDCKRVSSLTLPASLDSVHVRAFVGMAGVQTLTIADTDSPLQLFGVPSGINVHESMLSHLTALESANMGRNLLPTTYGNSLSAFHKAHMSTLTLGKLVSNLNANEFKGCSNLAIINSLNPTPPACADATTFDSVDKTACALHVPLGCKGAYQAAPVWEAFFSVTDDLPNDNPTVRGDINGDNTVDVGDVNMIINITLGKANPVSAADINGDGTVDVTDVNMIINITLGKL